MDNRIEVEEAWETLVSDMRKAVDLFQFSTGGYIPKDVRVEAWETDEDPQVFTSVIIHTKEKVKAK